MKNLMSTDIKNSMRTNKMFESLMYSDNTFNIPYVCDIYSTYFRIMARLVVCFVNRNYTLTVTPLI